eukprot:gnl/MRDRNA2_/MRDRNA2_63212_c0_seq2.p1 gnl/MRDRNA2_/MRDRNA2_63212_c0~~gnl/MRDRNA2_/MRDRNA2_63212_c0_seq2.p1  ORF type:complete len:1077 (+),score=215.75 gnl/MRDRNA2_/MRDRNA2_63212_c0_seq2:102-3332(+)
MAPTGSPTANMRKASIAQSFEPTKTINLLPYDPTVKAYEERSPALSPDRPRQWKRVWVMKFGGSSVGKRLPRVCESIFEHFMEAHRKGKRIAVVVSAMGKTTDLLLDAAAAAREQDLESALKIVKNIESLVVNNASESFNHFDVPDDIQKTLLKDIADSISNLLQGLNKQLQGVELLQDLSSRTLDTILSFGERSSSLCIGQVLDGILQHARSRSLLPKSGEITWKPMGVDATTFMCTDDSFGQARVDFPQSQGKLWELIAEWPKGAIPIFTGFIGKSTTCKSITTLGRNGSDYSAALIAAALRAEQLIINTDVAGVYTADPRIVPDAFPVPEMSYTEACELSMYGSKIFHPKSMLPLMELKIPMIIRNTSDAPDAPSTMIRDEDTPTEEENLGIKKSDSTLSCTNQSEMSQSDSECEFTSFLLPKSKTKCVDHNIGAVCIASLEDLSFLTIRAVSLGDDDQFKLDVSGRTKSSLERANIFPIWSDQRAGRDASILVKQSDREQAAEALRKEFASDRLVELSATEPVTLLSLVPKQHASRVGAASRFFSSLNAANVKIHRVVCGASTASISCLIDGRETGLAVQAAHNSFNFPERVVSLLILGNNRTSRGLIEELHRQRHHLRNSLNLVIRVCAVITEHGPMVLDSNGIPEDNSCPLKSEGVALADALEYMRRAQSNERCAWREQYDLTKNIISSQLRRLPTPVLVDCNEFPRARAQPGDLESLADCYLHCLQLGVRLVITESVSLNAFAGIVRAAAEEDVAPLKRNNSTPQMGESTTPTGRRLSLQQLMNLRPQMGAEILKLRGRLMRYDSCIAADIPLLPAMQSRLASGSRLRVVQGLLSSTIGLVLDMISCQGKTLREAVECADNEKITEQILKHDLGGYDVLEKLKVIAFALGWELPASKVRRVPLIPDDVVPDEVQEGVGRKEVFEALEKWDKQTGFSENAAKVYKSGRRLRYIATIELRSSKFAKAEIALEEVSEDHFTFPIKQQEISFALFDEPPDACLSHKKVDLDGSTECDSTTEDSDENVPKQAWREKELASSKQKQIPLVVRGPGTGYAHGVGALSDVVRLVKPM